MAYNGKTKILIIDGPRCVGKTKTIEELVKLGGNDITYTPIKFRRDQFCVNPDQSIVVAARSEYLGLVIAQMQMKNEVLVLDRHFATEFVMSIANDRPFDIQKFFKVEKKWKKFAQQVVLYAKPETRAEREQSRGKPPEGDVNLIDSLFAMYVGRTHLETDILFTDNYGPTEVAKQIHELVMPPR